MPRMKLMGRELWPARKEVYFHGTVLQRRYGVVKSGGAGAEHADPAASNSLLIEILIARMCPQVAR